MIQKVNNVVNNAYSRMNKQSKSPSFKGIAHFEAHGVDPINFSGIYIAFMQKAKDMGIPSLGAKCTTEKTAGSFFFKCRVGDNKKLENLARNFAAEKSIKTEFEPNQ